VKRLIAIATVLAAAGVLVVFATGADDDGSNYEVRAIFDNASFVIPGEDLKIAGVKVGKITALGVTGDKKASIDFQVEESGFQDFRTDAHCTIRPQSLIGERFVECTPTAPRRPGQPPARELQVQDSGPNKGFRVVPVQNTSTPVDIDLINNIFRLPFAQRFSIILSELGTGLAGNGKEVSEAIRRANPALKQVDQVLGILASQNEQLAQLAVDSDTVLAPLARESDRVADFIVQANTTAEATAERRGALEENLELIPAFLRELRPTMTQLGETADEMIPVLNDLGAQAPNINRFIEELGPFSTNALPAVETLGDAVEVGGPALEDALPIVRQLDSFSTTALPVADNLEAILTSVRETGGVERLMDFLFFQVAAINGFDTIGRYLRAGLIVNLCSSYAVAPVLGCSANFAGSSSSASAASRGPSDPVLERTRAVLRGADPEAVLAAAREDRQAARAAEASKQAAAQAKRASKKDKAAKGKGKGTKKDASAAKPNRRGPIALPPVTLPAGIGAGPAAAPSTASGTSQAQATSASGGGRRGGDPADGLLDYLLGGG
jgi:ABC-type transporter Mla subunit MlaD